MKLSWVVGGAEQRNKRCKPGASSVNVQCNNAHHEENEELCSGMLDRCIEGLGKQITLLHRLSDTIREASSKIQNVKDAKTFKILDKGNDVEPLQEVIFTNTVRDKFPSIEEQTGSADATASGHRNSAATVTPPARVQDSNQTLTPNQLERIRRFVKILEEDLVAEDYEQ
ncbi:hypothetical protein TSTA_104390 [Talaromyces stipitatus ATCC 10500]|uniref:Uncharacterized protein n=1 Tax=Talaromyces stipitatus (strain ATCC 10500 / CBS 375.48 / QM 6759 / NRRL 1006) TaxID=441959 RepID=B8MNY4_TALSN|nr:uncharacterized protein TSTA_104390 [Talaromyces stipitatus ATCC 10500]EED14223.1 hypothetical protein TSTA_104390 [Talaromyces stipitatus ATCC 10500]